MGFKFVQMKGSALFQKEIIMKQGKGHTFLHWEIIKKLQRYIHKILKSSPPELLDQFYNICNHNFAHLNWFIRWVVWPMGLLFKCTTRRNLSVKYYGHFKDFRLKHINHVTVYNTDWFFGWILLDTSFPEKSLSTDWTSDGTFLGIHKIP